MCRGWCGSEGAGRSEGYQAVAAAPCFATSMLSSAAAIANVVIVPVVRINVTYRNAFASFVDEPKCQLRPHR